MSLLARPSHRGLLEERADQPQLTRKFHSHHQLTAAATTFAGEPDWWQQQVHSWFAHSRQKHPLEARDAAVEATRRQERSPFELMAVSQSLLDGTSVLAPVLLFDVAPPHVHL